MKTSVKFFYTSLLLCLALAVTAWCAVSTIQAYQHFQQDHQSIQAGDVATVRWWMTVPYLARVYRVPEACFTQSLHLSDHWLIAHATLRTIADRYHRSLDTLILDVQHIILTYRGRQLTCGPPPQSSRAPNTHELSPSTLRGEAR